MPKKHFLSPLGVINPQYNQSVNANNDEDHLDPMYQTLNKKSRKAEICHIRFFIYQNPCLGMAKSLSWAVTKYCVEVGWDVTKYKVGSRRGVVS